MSPSRSKRVLVLGGRGMLGHAVVRHLRDRGMTDLAWTTRRGEEGGIPFDALEGPRPLGQLMERHGPFGWIVNGIAILQSLIDESDPVSRQCAEQLNGEFPQQLASVAAQVGARLIHVSTDAVFPPDAGRCSETMPPAPAGVYGQTKLRGEVAAAHVLNIRCSIVGPDPFHGRGLLEWLRSRPAGARVPGFTDHRWAGCTTLQLAELCRLLIVEGLFEPVAAEGSVQHFCPCTPLSKYELLNRLAVSLGVDVEVRPVSSGRPATRQLDTARRVLPAVMPKYAAIEPALQELAQFSSARLAAAG